MVENVYFCSFSKIKYIGRIFSFVKFYKKFHRTPLLLYIANTTCACYSAKKIKCHIRVEHQKLAFCKTSTHYLEEYHSASCSWRIDWYSKNFLLLFANLTIYSTLVCKRIKKFSILLESLKIKILFL